MFGKQKNDTPLEEAIARCLLEMEEWPQDCEEYATRASNLERLHKLKEDETPQRVDRNTLLVVGGNILTVLVIIAYEQKHVITTRGLPFLTKANIKSVK